MLADSNGGSFYTTELTGDKHKFEWMSIAQADEIGALFKGDELPEKSNFDDLESFSVEEFSWSVEKVTNLLDTYGVEKGDGMKDLLSQLQQNTLTIWENSSVETRPLVAVAVTLSVYFRNKNGEIYSDQGNKAPAIRVKQQENLKSSYTRLREEFPSLPLAEWREDAGFREKLLVKFKELPEFMPGLPFMMQEVFVILDC